MALSRCSHGSRSRQVRANLAARGFEPSLVRLPAVPDARLCTRHVLAMEYLPGRSLAAAIDAEMAEVASALGLESAAALREQLMRRVTSHFEGGGGGARLLDAAEAAAPLLRAYVAAARRVRASARAAAAFAYDACATLLGVVGLGSLAPPRSTACAPSLTSARPDLSVALRTLVRVHGVALLLDGVYNADPHPGNVLLLPDGRLGLIDYGMCGRLERPARESIARVVLGLAAGDRDAVVGEYEAAGYLACSHSGTPHGPDAVYRFATFHLDRIDLSPVRMGGRPIGSLTQLGQLTDGKPQHGQRREGSGQPPPPQGLPPGRGAAEEEDAPTMVPVMTLFRSTIEHSVPDWVEQARRLGGLLIGVGSQAGRPISLAAEWRPIAEEVLASASGERPLNARRLRTHLTGLA